MRPTATTKKKSKADGRCILLLSSCQPCPPPSGGDVIIPARIVANVLNDMFVGSEEEGAAMVVAELNSTTMTMTTLV